MATTDETMVPATTGEHPGDPGSTAGDGRTAGRPPIGPVTRWTRRVLAVLWLGSIVAFLVFDGVPVDRETIISFMVAGLLIWSIGRRPLWSVAVDWLPFVLVLIVYDYSRGAADLLGSPTQWLWQIDVDRFLGFGHIPTVFLQEHLKVAAAPLWEIAISLVYISFFFVPYLTAGWLWLRSRSEFRQFAVRFVTLSFLGLVGFVAMPAAPPWAAAQCGITDVVDHPANPACMDQSTILGSPGGGLLGPYTSHTADPSTSVDRLSSRGFASLGLPNAQELVKKGQASVNLVAAIPSLHAAVTLMVSIFLWPRIRKRWRPLLILYPPAMAFTLVYSAEHYLTDVLIGWVIALGLEFAVRKVTARRRARPGWRPGRSWGGMHPEATRAAAGPTDGGT